MLVMRMYRQVNTDLLVLLQCLSNRELLIGSITLLRMLYKTESLATAHVHSLELILGWHNLRSHDGIDLSKEPKKAYGSLHCML